MSIARRPPRAFSVRQAQVLDGLEELFVTEGMRLSVGEIAGRMNCSRRTLYELAPSKEELFHLVLDRMMRRLGHDAREAANAAVTPEARMYAFMDAAIPFFQPLSPAFMDAIDSHEPAGWLFEHHLSLATDFVIQTVKDGIAAGRFHHVNPELAAEALFGAVRRVTEPEVLNARKLSAAEALRQVFTVITDGLLKPDSHRCDPGAR